MHLIHQLSTSQATAHTLTSPCKAQHHLLQVEKEEGACDSTQEIIYLGKKQRSHFRVISKKGMWAKAINPKMYISAEACASGTLNRHQNTSVKHTDMSLQDHSNTTGQFTSTWKKLYILGHFYLLQVQHWSWFSVQMQMLAEQALSPDPF